MEEKLAKTNARKARDKQGRVGKGKGSEKRPTRVPKYDPLAFAREQRYSGHRTARDLGFR